MRVKILAHRLLRFRSQLIEQPFARTSRFIITTSTNGHSSFVRRLLASLHIPTLGACDTGRWFGGWCPFDADRLAGPLGMKLRMVAACMVQEQNQGAAEHGMCRNESMTNVHFLLLSTLWL